MIQSLHIGPHYVPTMEASIHLFIHLIQCDWVLLPAGHCPRSAEIQQGTESYCPDGVLMLVRDSDQ